MSQYVQISPDGTRTVVKYKRGEGLISRRITLSNRVRWLRTQLERNPHKRPILQKRLSDTSRQLNEVCVQIKAATSDAGPNPACPSVLAKRRNGPLLETRADSPKETMGNLESTPDAQNATGRFQTVEA